MEAKIIHDTLDFQYCIDGFDTLSRDVQYNIIKKYISGCIDNCIDTLAEVKKTKEDISTWNRYLSLYQTTLSALQNEKTRDNFLDEYHPKQEEEEKNNMTHNTQHFQACAFVDDNNVHSWENFGGIWFDDGSTYEWVEDNFGLTEEQAQEICKELNALCGSLDYQDLPFNKIEQIIDRHLQRIALTGE